MGSHTIASGQYSTAMGSGTAEKPCIAKGTGEFRACVNKAVFEINGKEISVNKIVKALCKLGDADFLEFC